MEFTQETPIAGRLTKNQTKTKSRNESSESFGSLVEKNKFFSVNPNKIGRGIRFLGADSENRFFF